MRRGSSSFGVRWLWVALASVFLAEASLHEALAAVASEHHASKPTGTQHHEASGDRAGPEGRLSTIITSEPFTVAGSPYVWSFTIGQRRPGADEPTEDPYIEIRASRHADGEESPEQVHTWRFRLPPGSLSFDERLRHGEFDTGSIAGYGSAAMEMVSLTSRDEAEDRCKWTHRVVRKRDWRSGILVGSFSFAPGYADPEFPSVVEIEEVAATIERSRSTGAACPEPVCTRERVFEGNDPINAYVLRVREDGSGTTLRFTLFEFTSATVSVKHHVIAVDEGDDTLLTSPDDAQIVGDIAEPFIDFGTGLRWTGEASPRETSRCIYERRDLFGGGTRYFDVYLDSGDRPLLPQPSIVTLAKRTPP